MHVDVQKLTDLSDELADCWRSFQGLTPDFMTPLVGPDFARLVGRHRNNAKVAIGYQDGIPIAFFAFHPTVNGHARAVGAPFCDYQALVTAPDVTLNGPEFLEKAGIASIFFSSLMDPHGHFPTSTMAAVDAYRINCNGDGVAHMETLRSANPKWAKNLRRLGNKMDRELGTVRLISHDTNQSSFDALVEIKVAQYHESGITNVLGSKWIKAFMQDLFDMQGGDFGGCLVSLYAGDKFVAGQFGARQGDWFHPWIASTCPLSHPYSPGVVFLSEMIQHSTPAQIRVIDLSAGHSHYKIQFCRTPYIARAGTIGTRPGTAPNQGGGALGLISRRLDLIGAVEADFGGQVLAIASAIAAIPRRIAFKKSSQSST